MRTTRCCKSSAAPSELDRFFIYSWGYARLSPDSTPRYPVPHLRRSRTVLGRTRSQEVESNQRTLRTEIILVSYSGDGRFKDALNRCVQRGVIVGIGLLDRQPFHQSPREARHNAVIPTKALVAFFQRVPPRQRNHFENLRMFDAISVKVVLVRQGYLDHARLPGRIFFELFKEGRFKQCLSFGFFGTVNILFRLDDRHGARRENLRCHLELLVDHRLDAGGVGLVDEGAHFGSEDALCDGLIEQGSQPGYWLQQVGAVLLFGKAFVHFQEWHNAFHVPKIVRGRLSLD